MPNEIIISNVTITLDTDTGVMKLDSHNPEDPPNPEPHIGSKLREWFQKTNLDRKLLEGAGPQPLEFRVASAYVRVKVTDESGGGHDPVFVDTRCP